MAKKLQRKLVPQAQARPAAGAPAPRGGLQLFRSRKIPRARLVEFTVQLATLLDAGVPIVRALRVLEGQTPPGPFKAVQGVVTQDVEGGSSLSEAMEKHAKVFDKLYANMVRAGEIGGVQDVILLRLADFMSRMQAIRSKVFGAMAYPAAVVVIAVGVVLVLLMLVIPAFIKVFSREGIELPALTRYMIAASNFARDWFWLFAIVGVGGYALHRVLLARSTAYRLGRDRLLFKLPLVGPLMVKTYVARFARTFGTLIQSGVPHLDGLEIVKDSMGNLQIQNAIEAVRVSIREGEGLARPMQESRVFDDIVVNMVDVGEETGELDRMLLKVADRYEQEVDQRISLVFKVIEPVIIVFLAVVVGGIVLALFMPMVRLIERLGTGGR